MYLITPGSAVSVQPDMILHIIRLTEVKAGSKKILQIILLLLSNNMRFIYFQFPEISNYYLQLIPLLSLEIVAEDGFLITYYHHQL